MRFIKESNSRFLTFNFLIDLEEEIDFFFKQNMQLHFKMIIYKENSKTF